MSVQVDNDSTFQSTASLNKIIALDSCVFPETSQTRLGQQESFQQLPHPPKLHPLEPKQECRICFESTNKLISPCMCTGSGKYIHEECLKTWLLRTMDKSATGMPIEKCELCGWNMNFTVKIQRVCTRANARAICHQNLNLIILNIIVASILFIAFGLTTWLLLSHISINKMDVVAILMIISLIAFLTIGTFLIISLIMKLFVVTQKRISNIEEYKPAVKI